jgi:hypothetical protein
LGRERWTVSLIGRKRSTGHLTVLTADQKPVAREDELVVEEVGEELLVYDQTNDTAHSLSVPAARVWLACDGERSAKGLSAELDLDADTVARALEELDECNLLDNGQPITGMTRREASLKTAKLGAAAVSAPLIYSILAPPAALAVTQAYCLGLLQCTPSTGGGACGTCHMAGCQCCGPGNPQEPSVKICTADCTPTNCSEDVIENHCGPFPQPSPSCTGPEP